MNALTDSYLQSALDRIRDLVERKDCVLMCDISRPATTAELNEVDAFIGAKLPTSLAAFLLKHNGLHISVWSKSLDDASKLSRSIYMLSIYGTERIITGTKNLRSFLDGIAIEEIEEEAGGIDLRKRLYRCINVGSTTDSTQRIVFSLDEARADGEYALLYAEVNSCPDPDWISAIGQDLPKIEIAVSLNEFLYKAFDFMIATEGGFRYWSQYGPEFNW